jgi:hypothetical protein
MTDMLQAYLFSDEFGGRSAGNEGCRNHNVYFSALFKEELHFGFDKFFRHFFCVPTSTRAIFFNFNLDEFSAERLNLLTSCRTCIKTPSDGSESTRLNVVSNSKIEGYELLTVAIALKPATPAPITSTLQGGI